MIANQPNSIPTQLSLRWNLTLDHTWLPDGSAMVASVREFRGVRQNRLWRIPLIGNADDSAELYLDDEAFIHTDFPRFSPDGRYLALRNAYSLVVVEPDANSWQRFDIAPPGNTPPVWSPAAFAGEDTCPE
jgi:Tol biopolymer transport system component